MNRCFASKVFLAISRLLLVAPGLFALSGLTGCGNHSAKSVVIMQHPETMDFVNCSVDAWATPASYAKNARCVEDLKEKGYIVWGER